MKIGTRNRIHILWHRTASRLRSARTSVKALLFRLRHGFDYRDTWSLNLSLAKWLAPRLRHLSGNCCGAPYGYPLDGELLRLAEEANFEATGNHGALKTHFDAWRMDLRQTADQLEALVKWGDNSDVGDFEDSAQYWEIEEAIYADSKEAMQWVADNFHSLWD